MKIVNFKIINNASSKFALVILQFAFFNDVHT